MKAAKRKRARSWDAYLVVDPHDYHRGQIFGCKMNAQNFANPGDQVVPVIIREKLPRRKVKP